MQYYIKLNRKSQSPEKKKPDFKHEIRLERPKRGASRFFRLRFRCIADRSFIPAAQRRKQDLLIGENMFWLLTNNCVYGILKVSIGYKNPDSQSIAFVLLVK